MRILFDQGTPKPLHEHLSGHEIRTAFEGGWSDLSNGELLAKAEKAGFSIVITTDQNLRYQQNLEGRIITILVLPTTKWPEIRQHVEEIRLAVLTIKPGAYHELSW